MNDIELKSVLDAIQNLILIKQQNLLIYCWMELKKRNKKIILESSRAKSQYNGAASLKNSSNKSQHSHYFQAPRSNISKNSQFHPKCNDSLNQHHIQNSKKFPQNALNRQFDHSDSNLSERYEDKHEYHRQSDNEEAIEDEEFQDIVLERLSKLQENINQLMRQKKIKQKRSQCSTPLSNYIYKKQPFFQPQHTKQTRKDIINNFKYIPVDSNYKPKANIPKIRSIIKNKTEQQNLIDNVDYFVGDYIQTKNDHIYNDGLVQKENTSRQKSQNLNYLNRYNAKTTRNNMVHFVPNNLQMLTVIESRSRFFSRKADNSNNIKIIEQQQKKSNPKSSGSKISEYSTRRNHFSSFY